MIPQHAFAGLVGEFLPLEVAAVKGISTTAATWLIRDVINLQETRFARLAARRMSVGAFFYAAGGDASLHAAQRLLGESFPFLKRSLIGRYAGLQNEAALRAFLAAQGHPL